MRIIVAFFFFCTLVGIVSSCNQKENKSEKTTEQEEKIPLSPDSVKQLISLAEDSINNAWNEMMQSDNQKFQDIKRLLQEISYTSGHDAAKLEKLNQMTDSVKSLRYEMHTMTSSEIDQYDAATGDLIKETFKLVSETPEMESHTITKTLQDDIMKADNELVQHRIHYDNWAKDYNRLIRENRTSLQEMGEPYSSLKEKPLFELPS